MTSCLIGSRSRRAAALSLLCACAFVGQAKLANAQEIIVGDQPSWGDAVVSDGGCYGGCDGYCSDGYCGCDNYCGCDECQPGCNDSQCCLCPGWFSAEYILWRLDGSKRLPPLVTASPSSVPIADAAQLDEPGTFILAGDEKVNNDWRSGYRFSGGFWLDCCQTCGIGADYFELGDDDFNFLSPQDSSIITGRPFFNTQTGQDDAELVSVPNELDGTANVRSTDSFRGAGLTLNKSLWRCCDPCCGTAAGLTMIGGYRFYEYDTNLSITENLTVLPGTTAPLVPGTTFFVQDRFRTHNEFNGGEMGLQGYKKRCCWWVDGMAKVAMGNQHRTVRVNGTTIVDVPNGGVAIAEGGLLTSSQTNIGRYDDNDFVVIPEFRLGLGACVTKRIAVRAGYNCIIWSDVARAGSHLPPGLEVDPRNLPPVQQGGGSEPEFPGVRGSQLIAHGLDASVLIQW